MYRLPVLWEFILGFWENHVSESPDTKSISKRTCFLQFPRFVLIAIEKLIPKIEIRSTVMVNKFPTAYIHKR